MEWLKENISNNALYENRVTLLVPPDISPDEIILKMKQTSGKSKKMDILLDRLQVIDNKLLKIESDIDKREYFVEIASIKLKIMTMVTKL
jgi:hypothetical protein